MSLTFTPAVQLKADKAGLRLLGSIERIAREVPYPVTITCGCEAHKDDDPHTLGRAFDLRTHTLSDDQKRYLLRAVLLDLQEKVDDAPMELTLPKIWFALATSWWFGQIEDYKQPNEHLHVQLRRGAMFL